MPQEQQFDFSAFSEAYLKNFEDYKAFPMTDLLRKKAKEEYDKCDKAAFIELATPKILTDEELKGEFVFKAV